MTYEYPAEVVRSWRTQKERAACIGFDAMRLLLGLAPVNVSAAEVVVEITKCAEAYLRSIEKKP